MSEMTATRISGNMQVVHPSSWITLNSEESEGSSHACVLSCPVAISDGQPTEYLYFSNKPCSDFDEEDKDRLYRLVAGIWPQFANIRIAEEEALSDHLGTSSIGGSERIDAGIDIFASKHKIAGKLLKKLKERIEIPNDIDSQFDELWKEQTGMEASAFEQAYLASKDEESRHIIAEIPLRGHQPKISPVALTAYIEEIAQEGGRQG